LDDEDNIGVQRLESAATLVLQEPATQVFAEIKVKYAELLTERRISVENRIHHSGEK